ncbi:hypothetical protein G7046_g783 [Stylonectria norvegica]|nr:hypothetical protein G7046_g783 [Stylonectria norvegica]
MAYSLIPTAAQKAIQPALPFIDITPYLAHTNIHPLKDLPVQRELIWRNVTQHAHLVNRRAGLQAQFCSAQKDEIRILTALLVQVTGIAASIRCKRCVAGLGLWDGCVVPPLGHGRTTNWACANCYYMEGKTDKCSLFMDTQLDFLKGFSHMKQHEQNTAGAVPPIQAPTSIGPNNIGMRNAVGSVHATEATDHTSRTVEGLTPSSEAVTSSQRPNKKPRLSGEFVQQEDSQPQFGGHGLVTPKLSVSPAKYSCEKVATTAASTATKKPKVKRHATAKAAAKVEEDIEWPVIHQDYVRAWQQVGRLMKEPLMSMDELDKELEGWYE